jgi:hypothetical protein
MPLDCRWVIATLLRDWCLGQLTLMLVLPQYCHIFVARTELVYRRLNQERCIRTSAHSVHSSLIYSRQTAGILTRVQPFFVGTGCGADTALFVFL